MNEYESAGLMEFISTGQNPSSQGTVGSTTTPTQTGLESNPYLVSERPTTNGSLCFLALVLGGE